MALSAKQGNTKKTLDVPEKGTHMARLVGLTDLGHQPAWEYNGEEVKDSFQVTFTYELPNSKMADGRPHWVSEDVNVNDFEGDGISSKMMKRVRAIDTQNKTEDGKDLTKMIGEPCMLSLDINAKGYPKVKDATEIMLGMDVPELENPTFVFDMDSPDMDKWNDFPEFTQKKIMNAMNFPDSMLGKLVGNSEDDF